MKIGIDLGGTTMIVGAVNDNNEIVAKLEAETCSKDGADRIIERLNELTQKVIQQFNIDSISHIGIGCPGMLDRENGRVIYSNNLHWEDVFINKKLMSYFDVPVYLENDANCAAIGEYKKGSGKDYDSMIMITLGTGIGGGIIIDNKLYRGKSGNSNILGHIVVASDGELCTCGRKGCWEAYASVTALINQANEMANIQIESELYRLREKEGSLTGRSFFTAIQNGDKSAKQVFARYVKYVSEGIIDIVNVFEPHSIVIGGGISQQGELLLKPVREIVEKNIYCGKDVMPYITTSCLGNDAGIIGASCLNEY